MQIIRIAGIGTGVMDILHTKQGDFKFVGGSTANTLYTLQKLGISASIIGNVGNDEDGKIILENLKKVKMDLTRFRVENRKTALCHIKIKSPRRKILYHENLSPIQNLHSEDKTKIAQSDAVFLRLSNPLFPEVAQICKNKSKKLFVTMHDFKEKDPCKMMEDYDIEVLFTGKHRKKLIRDRMNQLVERGTIIVLTKGKKGFEVYSKNDIKKFKGLKVKSVDNTGAGDAFAGGFIFGYLSNWDLDETCSLANFLGAVVSTNYGSRTRIPSLDDYFDFKARGISEVMKKMGK